ncbi:MAG: hypothetical protein R6U19_03605 [Bacteroidales bacterium]
MQIENIKQEVHRILDKLPEEATWDDLMEQIYVRQAIEQGIKDSYEGKTVDVQEVRKKLNFYLAKIFFDTDLERLRQERKGDDRGNKLRMLASRNAAGVNKTFGGS